jgi:hypothetical protein
MAAYQLSKLLFHRLAMPKDKTKKARPRNRLTKVRMAVDIPGPDGKPRPELRTLGLKERTHLNDITNTEMLERIAGMSIWRVQEKGLI